MRYMIGVDIGGTFVDAVVADESGHLETFKSPSTPDRPAQGLINCIELAASHYDSTPDQLLSATEKFTYGTTITTNILLERNGANIGLVTTEGFRDTLPLSRIGREHLPADSRLERPDPLIPRSRIREVPERIDSTGSVLTPLDMDAARDQVDDLLDQGCEAIAIAFLWSIENPAHEIALADYVREHHGVDVVMSSNIAPVQGEYERSATAVMNGYVKPNFTEHIDEVVDYLREHGYRYPLLVMQSTGGVFRAETATERPISTLYSGPAGAIAASSRLSDELEVKNLINMDMGGTSFDVSVFTNGDYEMNQTSRAGGYTLYAPQIDIHSIGAGGGSIAWLDKERLRVGPESAGARPGPVSYDRGGEEPTVTDADVLLGHINPDNFVGGGMRLDKEKATRAIEQTLADPLGLSVTETAAHIRRIVDATMADAIRVLTVEKGRDPRDFTIVACGGAGPVHAMSLARQLGIGDVVVPYTASVHSALGILSADLTHRLSSTLNIPLTETDVINDQFFDLANRAAALLEDQGVPREDISFEYTGEMRFEGQHHELGIQLPSIPLESDEVEQVQATFESTYRSRYGRGSIFDEATVELVRISLTASAETTMPDEMNAAEPVDEPTIEEHRPVYFLDEGEFVDTAIYPDERFPAGSSAEGPCIIERKGTTIIVPPGHEVSKDARQNVRIRTEGI